MLEPKTRQGEEEGREYFFLSREQFEKRIADRALIEYAEYCGNYYGTPRDYVEKELSCGRDVILEIEIQGALKIKEQYPEAVLLFVTTPSAGELRRRLSGRGTETAEVIEKRLGRAVKEAEGIERYDYIVINDDLETCVEELHGIITAAHHTPGRNGEFIQTMRRELEGDQIEN